VKLEARIHRARDEIASSLQDLIHPNAFVLITDLENRSDLNGGRARVLFWSEPTGRWAVKKMDTGEKVKVRPRNLLPLLDQQAKLELKEHMANAKALTQQKALNVFMMRNDRRQAWNYIRDGYRLYPMLIWNRVFEINDSTVARPLTVAYAARLQNPSGYHGDAALAQRIMRAIERSEEEYVAPPNNNIIYFPEDHEKVDPEDKHVLYWFLIYVQLDCEDWTGALESLARVIKLIPSETSPLFYLAEVLYYTALVEFGLRNRFNCKKMLHAYNACAHPHDRHRRDASILQMWVDDVPPAAFHQALEAGPELDIQKTTLQRMWCGDTFSPTPWVLAKVAEALGAEYQSPYLPMVDLIKNQWNKTSFPKPQHVIDTIEEFTAPGYPHGVTVRHRMSRDTKAKMDEEHERMMRRMYEGW